MQSIAGPVKHVIAHECRVLSKVFLSWPLLSRPSAWLAARLLALSCWKGFARIRSSFRERKPSCLLPRRCTAERWWWLAHATASPHRLPVFHIIRTISMRSCNSHELVGKNCRKSPFRHWSNEWIPNISFDSMMTMMWNSHVKKIAFLLAIRHHVLNLFQPIIQPRLHIQGQIPAKSSRMPWCRLPVKSSGIRSLCRRKPTGTTGKIWAG